MKVAAGGSPCWVPELSTPLFTLKGSLEPHQHATWILRPPWILGGAATTPRGSASAVPTEAATWGGRAAGSERGGGLWWASGCPKG